MLRESLRRRKRSENTKGNLSRRAKSRGSNLPARRGPYHQHEGGRCHWKKDQGDEMVLVWTQGGEQGQGRKHVPEPKGKRIKWGK